MQDPGAAKAAHESPDAEAGRRASPREPLRRGEALSPAVVRPADAPAIVAGGIGAAVAGVALIALALANLPGGAVLLAAVLPLLAWAWLSARAWSANAAQRELRARGVVVLGDVDAIERTGDHEPRFAVRYGYRFGDRDYAGEAEGLDAWTVRRYEPAMQLAVLLDPDAPAASQLFPPPGGGGALDLMGDVVAWLIRPTPAARELAASEPSPSPDETPNGPSRPAG